jgi:hypothetical protein
MKQLEVEFAMSPVSDHATNVILALHYVVKFGIVGRLLGATVMLRALTRMANRMLDGLAAHLTEGREPSFGAKATAQRGLCNELARRLLATVASRSFRHA